MAGTRSELIRSRVNLFLPDASDKDIGEPGNIFYVMNRVINRICQECGVLQATQTISIVGGTELYDVPDGFLAERAVLSGTSTPLEKKRMDEVVEIKRIGTSLDNTTVDPTYYYKWNNQIGFMNPAGGSPGGASTVTLYGWRVPASDGSEDASETVDPIVDQRWDYCIELGTLAMLGGDPMKYEMEFARMRSAQVGVNDSTYQIAVSRDYD